MLNAYPSYILIMNPIEKVTKLKTLDDIKVLHPNPKTKWISRINGMSMSLLHVWPVFSLIFYENVNKVINGMCMASLLSHNFKKMSTGLVF